MTKLRLGPIAEEKPGSSRSSLPGALMPELGDYAAVHAQLTDLAVPLPPERLIPAMVERFIASDREFSKQRRSNN
ncbi:MAG: DUF2274 domain-containing protein [Sphingopyxis sp.]|nr:DUF2274 domain-containing protein [Sphingopyxis sp.]